MKEHLRPALTIFLLLTVLTGVIYPALVTLIAQGVFPRAANGSLLEQDGKTVGSELIGQAFNEPGLFWGRPSATSPEYNGGASTGSNLGPINPALTDAIQGRVENIRKAHPGQGDRPVPVDLVTASGSGLDPHISPAAAEYQVARVAAARGLTEDRVRQLVAEHTAGRTLGLLGEPRVNVLQLNLALQRE